MVGCWCGSWGRIRGSRKIDMCCLRRPAGIGEDGRGEARVGEGARGGGRLRVGHAGRGGVVGARDCELDFSIRLWILARV